MVVTWNLKAQRPDIQGPGVEKAWGWGVVEKGDQVGQRDSLLLDTEGIILEIIQAREKRGGEGGRRPNSPSTPIARRGDVSNTWLVQRQ